MNNGLQIGEMAKRAGVSIDTLRYYEKVKLLPRPARSSGGFRLFALDYIDRVRFIKQAQDLGFTLEEIKGLLAKCETELKQHGASACCPVVAGGKQTKQTKNFRRHWLLQLTKMHKRSSLFRTPDGYAL
jgi:DNA-binding transcriptional MerR regulator